jgi:hypothetical protein
MADDRIARCLAAVEQLATVGLAAARTEEHVAALLREVDAAVTGAIGPSDGPRDACGRGCASCCQLNVGTLAVEGAVVAAFLRRAMPSREVAATAERLEWFHQDVRWLDDGERVRGRFRCPFLDARRRDVSGMTAPFLADTDLFSAWLAGAELPIG